MWPDKPHSWWYNLPLKLLQTVQRTVTHLLFNKLKRAHHPTAWCLLGSCLDWLQVTYASLDSDCWVCSHSCRDSGQDGRYTTHQARQTTRVCHCHLYNEGSPRRLYWVLLRLTHPLFCCPCIPPSAFSYCNLLLNSIHIIALRPLHSLKIVELYLLLHYGFF